MATSLQINVPNIASVIATYDVLRLFRSDVSRDGPFTELTGASVGGAVVTGTVAGPFTSLNGKTLILRLRDQSGTRPDFSVTFSDANPISIAQVVTACNAAFGTLVIAANDGSDRLELTTVATGKAVQLAVVGGTALADLGFALNQRAVGSDPFIPLVAGDENYEYYDAFGTDNSWYRWQFYHTGTLASSGVTSAIQANTPTIDPVHKLQDFRATRGLTLVRGRENVFRMAFWDDQEAQVPLVPVDAGKYPSYAIIDPNGQVVQSGVAAVDGTTPNYKVAFTPPIDAILTNDDRRYRIDWFLLTNHNRPVQSSEIFDLRDVDVTESEIKELKYLALDGAAKRLRLALPNRPVSISLQIESANNPDITMLALPAVFPPSGPNPSLTEIADGDRYVYAYDVPAGVLVSNTVGSTYQSIWTVLETPTSEEDYVYQIIEVPPRTIFQHMVSLRMGLDKYQTSRDSIQAYQDSDLYEYLKQGLNIINATSPVHLNWSPANVPGPIVPYWILASWVWGLMSQYHLESVIKIGFSGQTVTLDYDRTADIDASITRALELLNGGSGSAVGLPAAKLQLFRKGASVGSYSGRPTRRAFSNYVYPISRQQGGANLASFTGLLAFVGLI